MKTDYTLTPEYDQALRVDILKSIYERNKNIAAQQLNIACIKAIQARCDASDVFGFAAAHQVSAWLDAYEEARKSHAAGQPLIRTACKIAARILFVLLLVGIALGVML